ncbi:MAG: lytic transglycosylase domain-containing protein [Steroidobacteraceae bacterium]
MVRRSAAAGSWRKRSPRPKRRTRLLRFWSGVRLRRRAQRAFHRAPRSVQVITCLVILATLALAINWIYQVVRKPSELFFPVSGALYKTPSETWREYEPAFQKYSTSIITPELLAALAQVEGSGNPIVRTYWRWSWRLRPFEVYRPASSAVGMYQITDGTFAEARHYCIHGHVVAEDGPWNDWRSCWFNSLYVRVIPSHAVELTSAYLDHAVTTALQRHRLTSATVQQKQRLAAVIHLCGAGAGDVYARRHFRLIEGQRCGDHEVRVYVARVEAMQGVFSRLAAAGDQ